MTRSLARRAEMHYDPKGLTSAHPFAFTVYSTHNIMKYQIIDFPWKIQLDHHHLIKGC